MTLKGLTIKENVDGFPVVWKDIGDSSFCSTCANKEQKHIVEFAWIFSNEFCAECNVEIINQ